MTDWQHGLEKLEGAYSDYTLRGYASDMNQFALWCAGNGAKPLPAASETVVTYIDEEAARLRPSTLKRRLCGIGRIHRLLCHQDPTNHDDVKLALRRARRKTPDRPKQALGVTAAFRDRLVAVCGEDLIALRDEVLLRVGFDTLCRRSELVALRAEDLTENTRGNLSILVRRAKNDQTGQGRTAPLSTRTTECVRQWLERTGVDSGPLLRPVYGEHTVCRYLEPVIVSRVLKKLTARSEMPRETSNGVSGHSLRIGAAQQLTINGNGILQIMRAGGWRSVAVVARYIENVDLDLWS
ncbi:MAG: hypothetical protein EOO81_07355 [Oxalobacteraceae bacterium]|nr:MAG: hypothetical protein EOO81_07355 [Oxalobacteraceae bacterium]